MTAQATKASVIVTIGAKIKTTLFRRWGIAEADGARDFLLKTGLKSDFGPVKPDLSVTKSNWAYAVSKTGRKNLR